jgi:methionyl-tRNA formyltransferase
MKLGCIRVLLVGTNHPAVPTFEMLIKTGRCCGLIMPPNKEVGDRNNELMKLAELNGIKTSFSLADIDSFGPQLIVAANYPKLISKDMLSKYICINTHWSLLPRWRGVHPTAWAILNDDQEIGYTIHFMQEDFDTGDVIFQDSVQNSDDLTLPELHKNLANMQADGVLKVIEKYEKTGSFDTTKQNHEDATYVPQRVPADGLIDWNWPARRIFNLIRVLPEPQYPGAVTFHENRKLVIIEARQVSCPAYWSTVGQVVRVIKDVGVWIKTADAVLEVIKVRWADESEVRPAWQELKRGAKLGIDLIEENQSLRVRLEELERKISSLEEKYEI